MLAAGRAIGSDRWVARLARLASAANSPSSVGFNLQDNIRACSDRTCNIQMRWLPARGPCTIEVEQCRWWLGVLGQAVLGISKMSLLNNHAICHVQRFNQATGGLRPPRSREVKAGIPCSSGAGRCGFDPRQLRRTKRVFFPPLAVWTLKWSLVP